MDYLLNSDDDDDTQIVAKQIIFTPKQLNDLLLNKTINISREFRNVIIMGEIRDCKIWKRSGMSFKITQGNDYFDCKLWDKDGCEKSKILELENKICKIKGYINAEYFHGHKFVVNVRDVVLEKNESNLDKFKQECENKGYFKNKKIINWNSIQKIGIISKNNTQGYNDFIQQYKTPIPLNLFEISLEGNNTYLECINAIKQLQNMDLIIIMRGGGDTNEISNSFDKLELFHEIKQSNIPIVTAIGHEFDKGDKLLITEVSDYNFPTPSTASLDISKIIMNPILIKLNDMLSIIGSLISEKFNEDKKKIFSVIKCLYSQYLQNKIGGPIFNVDSDCNFIIIEKNNMLYKQKLDFKEKMNMTTDEINIMKTINNAINNLNYQIINNYFNELNDKDIKIININDNIKKLKAIQKLEDNYYNIKPKMLKSFYCKKCNFKDYDVKRLIQLFSVYLYYKEILETNEKKMNEVYNYIKNL
jgi:exodeoxyribonuclease VII large subunit